MGVIWTSRARTRQPRAGVRLARAVADADLAYVSSMRRQAVVGGPLALVSSASPNYEVDQYGTFHWAVTTPSEGSGISATPRHATGTLTEATLIVFQRISEPSALSGWHDFQSTAVNSHFPYGGVCYLSTFSSSRWLSAATLPASVEKPHVVVVRANGTERKAWVNGALLGSGTADSTVQWSSFCIGTPNSGIRCYSQTYALLVLPRAVSDSFIAALQPEKFWQLFAPERRPVFYSLPAPSGTSSAVVWNARTRFNQPKTAVATGSRNRRFRPAALAIPSVRFDLVSGGTREVSGGVTLGVGASGAIAAKAPTSQIPGFIAYNLGRPVVVSGDFSLMVVASATANPGAVETHKFEVTGALSNCFFSIGSTSSGAYIDGNGPTNITGDFTKPTTFIVVRRGNQMTFYAAGQSTTGTTGTRTGEIAGLLYGRDRSSNNSDNGGCGYMMAAFDYGLSVDQINTLNRNPWQLFAPERRPKFFSVGSGANTYAVGISETVTASETVSMLATFGASISETATASETVATTAVLNASISETATASETVSMAASFVVTIGETATASETVAMALGAATFAVDISETATASETVSMLAAFGTSISETATASETMSMLAAFGTSISETATASETVAMQLANQTYAVAISETATASDTVVMTIPTTYAISIIETVQAGDYVSMGVPSSDFWTQVTTTQSAGWGQINNTQSSGWTIIPTT